MPNDHRPMRLPQHDDRGRRLGGTRLGRAPDGDLGRRTFGDPAWRQRMDDDMRRPMRLGEYRWFDNDGYRWCHHYDSYGRHWFGFYVGSVFFWTLYRDGRFWWEDGELHRSLYFRDGSWWWQDPAGGTYIYRGGTYYSYLPIPGGYEAVSPDGTALYYSADGTRMVQVAGADRAGTLYDNTTAQPTELSYLASYVTRVGYAGDGAALQVLVTTDQGFGETTTAYDTNGFSLGAASMDVVNPQTQFKHSQAFQSLQSGAPTW
ncbi:MAG: hypothetical protein KGL53_02470 [Elusimicrobia bacterium]|nr:hypothetical protein [Elusimicrobiota bacterium]